MFNPHILLYVLIILLVAISFFSMAETAMLSVNRYRLRHLVRQQNSLAKRVQQLLERPDRMLGVVLLCNTFANIFASAIATLLAVQYWGEQSVFFVTVIITAVILIFGEITPKTVAALYPERLSFFSAWPLLILLNLFYPVVWVANTIANGILRIFGIKVRKKAEIEHISHEELVSLLREAGGRIPPDYLDMLLKILDLQTVTVEDIMVPRNEIVGINLSEDWDTILEQLTNSQYTRLPVYTEEIDHAVGILHVRKALNLLAQNKLNKESLKKVADPTYFIPEGTPLNVQLLKFRREKKRSGLVVNEYGDIQGLVALEDILEEIVGEFTTDIAAMTAKTIVLQADGSYLVDGGISIRDLNASLGSNLPTTGPKTLSGFIIEHLEMIPHSPVALRFGNLTIEIVQIKGNVIKKVRVTK